MAEGAMISLGGQSEAQAWSIKAFRKKSDQLTNSGAKIKTGDRVMLTQLGCGNGEASLHQNVTEGGGFSGGGISAGQSWIIWGDTQGDRGQTIKESMPIQFEGCDTGNFLHSNAGEGSGFSLGGDSVDNGWTLDLFEQVDDDDSSSKVRCGARVMLYGNGIGSYLHSNVTEGGMTSLGGLSPPLAWQILVPDDKQRSGNLKSGSYVWLKGVGNGLCIHANGAEGGGYSLGGVAGDRHDLMWQITSVDGDDYIRWNKPINLMQGSDSAYMHSNSGEGSPLSFGGPPDESNCVALSWQFHNPNTMAREENGSEWSEDYDDDDWGTDDEW
jgi:hypothetical protein